MHTVTFTVKSAEDGLLVRWCRDAVAPRTFTVRLLSRYHCQGKRQPAAEATLTCSEPKTAMACCGSPEVLLLSLALAPSSLIGLKAALTSPGSMSCTCL